jgi:hypothetical protein
MTAIPDLDGDLFGMTIPLTFQTQEETVNDFHFRYTKSQCPTNRVAVKALTVWLRKLFHILGCFKNKHHDLPPQFMILRCGIRFKRTIYEHKFLSVVSKGKTLVLPNLTLHPILAMSRNKIL